MSLPAVQAGERLPAVPAADAYARAGTTSAIQLDPQRQNGAAKAATLDQRTSAGQAAVQDAALPPRRRAQDAARAPGFPASPYVAQLLNQEAFPPTTTAPENGLAAYQATIARNGSNSGHSLSLQA